MAGDAGHMTCTIEVVGSNVNDHIRAHEGKAFSTNTIRTLLSIDCAVRPSSAATGSRQRQPRRGGSSPSSRPCGGPFAFRPPPPRCRRPPRPSAACWQGSCSPSAAAEPSLAVDEEDAACCLVARQREWRWGEGARHRQARAPQSSSAKAKVTGRTVGSGALRLGVQQRSHLWTDVHLLEKVNK